MRIDPNTKEVTLTEIEYRELINLKSEVDLEKEAKECWDYIFPIGWDENSRMVLIYGEFMAFARHFYELGLNARKEE